MNEYEVILIYNSRILARQKYKSVSEIVIATNIKFSDFELRELLLLGIGKSFVKFTKMEKIEIVKIL